MEQPLLNAPWPVDSPTSRLTTLPSYPYVEYQTDDNISAFFDAYNIYTQAYVDWFNSLNLPIYTQSPVQGTLLDWIGTGLYNYQRVGLPSAIGKPGRGPVNTFTTNELPANGFIEGAPDTFTNTTDDFYRRILTWNLWKGDGRYSSTIWVKRRINRFLTGLNGIDAPSQLTYEVSITSTGPRLWTITLPTSTAAITFKNAVEAGVLQLPFQQQWTVTLV